MKRHHFTAFCTLIAALGCAVPPKGASDQPSRPATESATSEEPGASQADSIAANEDGAQARDPSASNPSASASGAAAASTETSSPRDTSSEARALPQGTKILHVGDSFAGALGKPLGKLLEAEGVRSVLKHTDSSYLTDWAWDGKLQDYLWKYNPDLVMVTLGANELQIVDPELRSKTVKKIISIIGERPCVWVAIPLWNGPQNGLLEVIRKNASPCVFMDTNSLVDVAKMPRIKDGIHPTTEAREEWATFVARWIATHRRPTEGRVWNIEP